MTAQQTQTLPDPAASYNHLFDNVHARVFFGKLASAGYCPENEKQAQDLLTLAGRLRVVNVEKAASDESPFSGPLAALDGVLNQTGMDGHVKAAQAQEAVLAVKEAAAELAADPTIYNCVLSLKAEEARQSQQQ